MTRKLKASILLLLFALVLAAAFFSYRRKLSNSRAVLAGKSAEAAGEGAYAEASRLIDRALQSPEDDSFTDEQLYLKKAEYMQKAGDNDQALSIAMRVEKNTHEGQQEFDEAWERIVSICIEEEEFGKLATLLEGSGVESVKSKYYNYLVYDPVFRDPPGTYEGSLALYIESQGEGAVFYTLDGTEPTEKSNLYSGPITLRPGIYTIKAFFINRYGLKSNTVTGAYMITED